MRVGVALGNLLGIALGIATPVHARFIHTILVHGDDTFIAAHFTHRGRIHVLPGGTLLLRDSRISGGKAPEGGCILNEGTAVLDNVTLRNCTARKLGGAISNRGRIFLRGASIVRSKAPTASAIANTGRILYRDTTLDGRPVILPMPGIVNRGSFAMEILP